MTVDEGLSVANHLRIEPTNLMESTSSFARISSTLSILSITTIVPQQGGYGGQLAHLIHLINNYTALQYATIKSTECYAHHIALGIPHRFLILELERPGKKTIWLRMDRMRSRTVSTTSFLRGGATTQANDIVRVQSIHILGLVPV